MLITMIKRCSAVQFLEKFPYGFNATSLANAVDTQGQDGYCNYLKIFHDSTVIITPRRAPNSHPGLGSPPDLRGRG